MRGGSGKTPSPLLPHRYASAELAAPGCSGCASLAVPAAPRAGQSGTAMGSGTSLPQFPHLTGVMVLCEVPRLGGLGTVG